MHLQFKFTPNGAKPLPAPQKPVMGLGDAVAVIAQPVAKIVDRLTGSKLVGCGGCARRRAALNQMVPDITKPLS